MHIHFLQASTLDADIGNGNGNMLGGFNNGYRAASNVTTLGASSVSNFGGSQAHENRQPFLALNFCIALQGIFPSQN